MYTLYLVVLTSFIANMVFTDEDRQQQQQ